MSVSYSAVKHFHVSAVVVSFALFTLRGAWMLAESDKLHERWVRIVPHVVDTLLLLSALWLAWQIGPEVPNGWLVAKVVGLVVYLILGTLALKRGRTRGIRVAALVGALIAFGYIVSVAITKSPLGFLARP
jgi:uncharacterized membrane protein SirB2